jgi:hypothetical protein
MFEHALRPTQRFYTVKEIEIQHKKDVQSGKFKLNSGGADQLALQKAMEESKSEFQKKKEAEETEQKQFFQGKGISLSASGGKNAGMYMEIYDSTELKIIKISLKEVSFLLLGIWLIKSISIE